MLFSNFLCLFYLMVLTRCHTISKSIESYDNIDDVIIDRVNDYPFTSGQSQHGRIPKYRHESISSLPTSEFVFKAHETTTESYEKAGLMYTSEATKRKVTTHAPQHTKTKTKALETIPAPLFDTFNDKENLRKPMITNLFKRVQNKFRWRNRTSAKGEKRKNTKKKLKAKDKINRGKRVASDTIVFNDIDEFTNMVSVTKTIPEKTVSYEDSKINANNLFEAGSGLDLGNYMSGIDKTSTLPIQALTSQNDLQDNLEFSGTESIEAMLDNVKKLALEGISAESRDFKGIVTNAATETVFDFDPVRRTRSNVKYADMTEQPYLLDFKDVVDLSEDVTSNPKPNARPNPLENKLQKDMFNKWAKAKGTFAVGINKAYDHVKGVTWKALHSAANELNDIANKIEHSDNVKEIPGANPSQIKDVNSKKEKLANNDELTDSSTPKVEPSQSQALKNTTLQKPSLTNEREHLKHNLKTTTPRSKFAHFSKNNHSVTKNSKGRPTTIKNKRNKFDTEGVEQTDYIILKNYEDVLRDEDTTTTRSPIIAGSRLYVKGFKDKLVKRDTETTENFNYKETGRQSQEVEEKPETDEMLLNEVEISTAKMENDGSTYQMTEATLHEIANPDDSYSGLTNKIHFDEYINGYKNYLNFTKEFSKFNDEYSNHVRYQAHRHHSVDDIGKFILTRLPTIPQWKSPQRKKKSGELYEPLEDWHEKLTTKSYESWFKRHFNLNSYRNKAEYTARSWKYDPKLGENDGLKFELQKGNQKKVVLDWLTHDKRLLGENEGLKVGWKWRKKMPKEKNVVSSYANDANENMVNANDATEKLSFNFDKMQKDLEVNDLVKSSVKMAMSNMYPEYTTPKDSISTNLNLKKLLADMSTSEISYVAPENEKALNIDSNNLIPNLYVRTIPSMKTRRTTEETTIDLDRLLSQISATTVTAKTVHLNELDSAYVLRNMPDENLSDISKTLNLRRAISKEIHKFTRNAKDNNVDDSFNTDGTEDNNLKSSRISIAPNEESLIKSTLPPNIFQDAALYPQKDATSNKGYVNLNVVDKPPTKKKKKNKFLCFDKWKFKKKKSKDTKDKKLERKSRIAKRSAFKKFKTLFKSAKTASNEPDHSTYETTESFSKKYVDMDVEELMKLVPHDSTGETTSFQMDPVTLKTSTFSESMAHTDLIPHDTTKLKQRKVKKYQKKLDAFYNNFKIPLNFRVSSSLKAKPTTILTIAVTPDESKNEFGLKVIESKLNNNEVSGVPKVYVTHSEDSKDLKFTPKLQSKVSTLKPTTELDQMPSTYLIKNKNKVVDNYLNEIMKGDTQKETPLQDVDIKNMINDFTCEDKTKNSFKKQTLNKDKDDTHIKSFRDDAVKDTVNNQDEIQTPYNYSKKKKRFSENDAQKGLPVPVLKNLRYGIDVTTDGIIKYESNDKDFAFYMNHQNNHKNNQRLAYSKTSGTLRTLTQKRNSQEMTTEFTKGRKSYLTYPDLFNDLIISNQDILSLDRVPDMSVANMLRNNIDATNPNLHVLNDVILGMDDGSTNTYTAYATTQAVPISKNTPKIKSKTARDAITNSNTVKREVKYNEQKLKTHFLDNNILRLVDKYGSSQNTMTSCVNCATESTKDSTVFTYDDSNLSENFNEDARNRMPKSLWSTTNSKSTLASKTKMIQSPEHYFRTPVPMKSDEFEKFLKDNNLSITKITAPYNKISQFEENWAKDNHIKSKLMDTKDDHDEDVQHSAELTALSSMKLPQSNKKIPGKINKNEVKTLKHTTSAYNSIYNHDNAESGSKAEGPIFNIEDVKIKRTIKTQPKITNPSTELDFDNFDITIIDIDDIMSGSDSDDVITPKENNTPAAVTKTTQKLKPQVLVSKDPLHRNENSKSANKIFSKYKPLVNSDSVESDTFLKTLDTKVNRRMKKVKGKTQCDKKSKAVNGQNDDLAEHLNVDKFVKVPEMATRRPSGESVHFSYYEYKHEHISAMPSKQYPYTSTESDDEFDDEEDMRDHNHNEFKPETQKTHTDAKLKQQRKSYAYSNRPSALTKLPDLFFNKERVPTVNRLKENFDPHQKLDKQPQRITFTSHTLKYDVMYDDISKKIKMHQQAFIQPLDVPLETTTPEPDAQKTSDVDISPANVDVESPVNTDMEGDFNNGGPLDGYKVSGEELVNKSRRKKRKALWRKWKARPTSITEISETTAKQAKVSTFRRWVSFMPHKHKTSITTPSTTSPSIFSLESSTSSPILPSSPSSSDFPLTDNNNDIINIKVTKEPSQYTVQGENWEFADSYIKKTVKPQNAPTFPVNKDDVTMEIKKEPRLYTPDSNENLDKRDLNDHPSGIQALSLSVTTPPSKRKAPVIHSMVIPDVKRLLQEMASVEKELWKDSTSSRTPPSTITTVKHKRLMHRKGKIKKEMEPSNILDKNLKYTAAYSKYKQQHDNFRFQKETAPINSLSESEIDEMESYIRNVLKNTASESSDTKTTRNKKLTTSSKTVLDQEANADKLIDNMDINFKNHQLRTKPSTTSSKYTKKTKNIKASHKHSNKSLTKPLGLKTSQITQPTPFKKAKHKTHPQTTKKIPTAQELNKDIYSRIYKREASECDNTIYTAKDVAALEVIVDLNEATESTTKENNSTTPHCDNNHNLSTNAIQVHIALPYKFEKEKRAAKNSILRKVFSAKMAVPVDMEYQVHSFDVSNNNNKPTERSVNCIPPGVYLLVEDTNDNSGLALKHLVRQATQNCTWVTMKTTSPKNLARVTINKDLIQSFSNKPNKHSAKKRSDYDGHVRNRRKINWHTLGKYLGLSNKRVCDCKCKVNKTMCKVCAASDAVMTELLFEFDNLAKYMNDHCTELQTYFWMNPSGGRKLRDLVHRIDKNINDYYKRVKGKCQGRLCSVLDKRDITMDQNNVYDDLYTGKKLLDEMEYLSRGLQNAQKYNLPCSEDFKNVVDHLVEVAKDCTGQRFKKSVPVKKKVYSVDNINVNIICNQNPPFKTDSPLSTFMTTSSLNEMYNTDFPVFDYINDKLTIKPRKSLMGFFSKKKNSRSYENTMKRDTFSQIDSPLQSYDARSVWKDHVNNEIVTNLDTVTQTITPEALEKAEIHSFTLDPSLKASLVKIKPVSMKNNYSRNEMFYPPRLAREDIFVTVNDLDTKTQLDNEMKELLEVFEHSTNESKAQSVLSKITKANSTDPLTTKKQIQSQKLSVKFSAATAHKNKEIKELLEVFEPTTDKSKPQSVSFSKNTNARGISSFMKRLTTSKKIASQKLTDKSTTSTKKMLSSEIKPVDSTPGTVYSTKIDDNSPVADSSESLDSLYEAINTNSLSTNKTKESLLHRLRNLLIPGYSRKQKQNDSKNITIQLTKRMDVPVNTNIDVISAETTTKFPTVFIIDDDDSDEVAIKTDDEPTNIENEELLIKVLEFERDKLANKLQQHKDRDNKDSKLEDSKSIVEVTDSTGNENLRAIVKKPIFKSLNAEAAKWQNTKFTDSAITEKGLEKTGAPQEFLFTATIKVNERKPLIQSLLNSMIVKGRKAENPTNIFSLQVPAQTRPVEEEHSTVNQHYYTPDEISKLTAPLSSTVSLLEIPVSGKSTPATVDLPFQSYQIDSSDIKEELQKEKSDDFTNSKYITSVSNDATNNLPNVGEPKSTTNKLGNVEDKSFDPQNSEQTKTTATISSSATNKVTNAEDFDFGDFINSKDTEDTVTMSSSTKNMPTNVNHENKVTVTSPIPKLADDVRLTSKPSQTQANNFKPTASKTDNVINKSNDEENASDKMEETRNKINEINKKLKKLKELLPQNANHEEEKIVDKINDKEAHIKFDVSHGQTSAESKFKKVLNKGLGKRKKYIIEACDPKTEVCLCDTDATSDHIVRVRRTMPAKAFEQYVKNLTCYRYKKPPPYFLLEPWKRKVEKRKHKKQRRCNKFFNSKPPQKNLKWDWIRNKRSLLSLGKDDADDFDVFEQEENNHAESDTFYRRKFNEDEGPKKSDIKNHNTWFRTEKDDGFEKLYKGDDNVYREVKMRKKRTAGDIKELAHGLRNLPPLQPKENEVYAMLGEEISFDCLHNSQRRRQKTNAPATWETDRSDMLADQNLVVDGPVVTVKKVEAKHSGNYTCSQNGKTRTVRLTVVTVPQLHVVFIPMYTSQQGCSYEDLRAMKRLGPLMSKETCKNPRNCNPIQIDEPICMEDRDDASVHLRAVAILTACRHPEVKCSAECRRDLQCVFALLCAFNAPVLHGVKVVIAKQEYNKTMLPSYGANRRLIVTHTLRKKDLRKHRAYHQLAAGMDPGNLDIVVSCPAGYYLIPKQKICAACPSDTYASAGENTCFSCPAGTSSQPGSSRCKLSLHRMRRYDWWWYPPCGYLVAAACVLCACVVCAFCAVVAHVTSRSTARERGRPVSVNWVDSRWTWSRRTGMKRCSSTSAGAPTRGDPPSPSAVILARFFRASASSSRVGTDSQEMKFEQWKEKNKKTQPPLPPIDFDLS